jgi:predicted transport protein
MAHYILEKGNLISLKEDLFRLEKEMQKTVENNLGLLFDLQYIRSEFQLDDLRIDTLAFDKQSNSFVIVEYKQDKSFSVIDQGFAYLSLMLNKKADFILEYNEHISSQLKKDDIDWTQSRVIFVSQSFTNYQRQAINFKDLPIELWEIKRYEDKSISLNQLISPSSSESIKTISKTDTVVAKVSKEVKKYTEDDHTAGIPENILELYNRFKNMILSMSDGITIRPRKWYLGFVAKTNFTDVLLQKSKIKIWLNLKKGTIDDPKKLARDISNVGHWGNGDYEISISDDKNLEYIISLVKQAYLKNK